MQVVDGLDFTIPENVNRIGIFYSGGIDSTALLCLIIEELKATNRFDSVELKIYTTYKPTGEPEYSTRLLNLINEKYSIQLDHTNSIPNTPEFEAIGVADPQNMRDVYDSYNGDIKIYVGANNSNDCPVKLPFVYTVHDWFETPFINLSKTHLINFIYDIQAEDLIPYTHTCSRQKDDKCGVCISCQERDWAFNELGLQNPDTIPLKG